MRGLGWLRNWISSGAERRREELAEYLVHDLKAPLAAVVANAELIARATDSDAKIQAALRDIRASTDQMLRMILDLRDVGRSAEGHLVPHKTSFEVDAFLEEVRQHASARGIWNGNQVALEPGSTVTIHADRELLRRIVDNLLDNAFRYAPTGGAITLAWEARVEDVEIRVGDGGPGVPAGMRDRIF